MSLSSHRGFLRSDKPIGTALVKLDKLESHSEIREIVEVSDFDPRTRHSDRPTGPQSWRHNSGGRVSFIGLDGRLSMSVSLCQVMDGRKPTGGRVEVKVRLREPLSGQDAQTSTERWLVIDRSQVTGNVAGTDIFTASVSFMVL